MASERALRIVDALGFGDRNVDWGGKVKTREELAEIVEKELRACDDLLALIMRVQAEALLLRMEVAGAAGIMSTARPAAAAPEVLAALKSIARQADEDGNKAGLRWRLVRIAHIAHDIRAAIAQATGTP